jgi:hypothetical protein
MKIKIISITVIVLGLLLFNSCEKDFEEINTNPLGFTSASTGSLFNSVVQSLIPSGEEEMYVVNEIIYKETQQGALTRSAWGNFSLGTEAMWTSYYGVIGEVRELEKRFAEMPPSAELNNMKAMLKILVAFKTFKLTDVFGDIPFFHAGYGYSDLEALHPAFDEQRDIYIYLLEDLKWADENISDTAVSEEPFRSFSAFDKLFLGDIIQWQKLANSMRLRYALRMSDAEPALAGETIKDVLENERPVFRGYDFLTAYLESGCLWPNLAGFDYYSTSWAFREQKNLRLGSNIWHQMSVHDSLDGSGIFDPRAFIFFETNYEGEWVAYPQLPETSTPPSGGTPYADHRDTKDAPENYYLKGADNIYSPFNYFLVRGGQMVPIILMTGAEVHYIKSEIYFKGIGVTADPSRAEDEYINGILASAEWWKLNANAFQLPNSDALFPDYNPIPPGLNGATVQYHFGWWNATNDEEKLKFLYTQRWLDAFWQPLEAYALARRTGLTPREGDPINHFRMPYPQSEAELNPENCSAAIARQGGDSPVSKIWWIP